MDFDHTGALRSANRSLILTLTADRYPIRFVWHEPCLIRTIAAKKASRLSR
jgi:hypothetical protein